MKKIGLLLLFWLGMQSLSNAQTNNAYGDNQKEVEPGVFAIYSGDINQDGVVDIFDVIDMDNDVISFAAGYVTTDLNGDGVVDIFDIIILDNNVINFVAAITPAAGFRTTNPSNNSSSVKNNN
jgi:hypothetical protein